MKQTFFLLVIITICSLTASAQIKKSSIYLGGDVSLNRQSQEYTTSQPVYKYNYTNFNITAGWFAKQNFVLGIYAGYGHSHFNNSINPGVQYVETKASFYNAGFFARQYKKLAKDFYLFGELGTGYLGYKETDVDKPSNVTVAYKQNGAELYLTPGISYRLYKKLNVELSIPRIVNLQYTNLKENSSANVGDENRFNFSTSLNTSFFNSLSLGFRFIL